MTLVYEPTIIEHPSPNYSERKKGVRVDTVLLHHTASDNDFSTAGWLCNPDSGVSAHYLVCTDGRVLRLVLEHRKAWHAGKGRLPWETCEPYDFNHRSIGIEVVNPGDGKTPFTEAQYRALAWLVPDIVKRLGWDAVNLTSGPNTWQRIEVGPALSRVVGSVLGHRDVAPGRKTDPADNFDWSRIREALTGGVS
jgi:N-acetylmuramoyl-L-alanine amidase